MSYIPFTLLGEKTLTNSKELVKVHEFLIHSSAGRDASIEKKHKCLAQLFHAGLVFKEPDGEKSLSSHRLRLASFPKLQDNYSLLNE